jgi:hypothetical protein
MCLKIKAESFTEDTFKVSEEDVECYKLYIERYDGRWVTPIRNVKAPRIGEKRQSNEPFNILGIHVNDKMETRDGIHTYSNIDSIIMMILSNSQVIVHPHPNVRQNIRVVKSIIPKGTRYLEGTTGLGDSYSSEYLVDVEVIFQINSIENKISDSLKKLLEFIRK